MIYTTFGKIESIGLKKYLKNCLQISCDVTLQMCGCCCRRVVVYEDVWLLGRSEADVWSLMMMCGC